MNVPTGRVSFVKKYLWMFQLPSEMEQPFAEDYIEKSIGSTRLALVIGCLLYASFGILDALVAPSSKIDIWLIRYLVVCPVLLTAFGLTFIPQLKKHLPAIMIVVSLVTGFGIIAMFTFIIEEESRYYYYAGLMLVLMWVYTFLRLRFVHATIVSWIIVIGYECVAIFFLDMLSTRERLNVFINNNFFFLSSNIIGMFACLLIESYSRIDFFQRMTIAMKQRKLEKERNKLKIRDEIISGELAVARIIQEHLVPPLQPKENICALYRPMNEVGGDFYDFIEFREKTKTGIFLSDVAGHGVPAALITAMIKSILLHASQYKNDPAKLMLHLYKHLDGVTHNLFVTAFYGIYDGEERTLTYCSAGHPPPFVIDRDGVSQLDQSCHFPIALVKYEELMKRDGNFENITVKLPKGGKILLYTDGVIEAKASLYDNTYFKSKINGIMQDLLDRDSREFVESLYGELVRFKGDEKFTDDICLICVAI